MDDNEDIEDDFLLSLLFFFSCLLCLIFNFDVFQ
jgi:hypothetical protein